MTGDNPATCRICEILRKHASGEEQQQIVYESEHSIAIYITQKSWAQEHIAISTKKHIPTIFDLTEDDNEIVTDVMNAIKTASKKLISLKGACKLEMYLGEFQNTKHFHCHVIYNPSDD